MVDSDNQSDMKARISVGLSHAERHCRMESRQKKGQTLFVYSHFFVHRVHHR